MSISDPDTKATALELAQMFGIAGVVSMISRLLVVAAGDQKTINSVNRGMVLYYAVFAGVLLGTKLGNGFSGTLDWMSVTVQATVMLFYAMLGHFAALADDDWPMRRIRH